jgi:hypothetical protein
MPRTSTHRTSDPSWRVYSDRDGRKIERVLRDGGEPHCPKCGGELSTESGSRLCPSLILDARACDLTCSSCRRFWCVVRETQRSLQLIRMRRLAAAVKAAEPPKRSRPKTVTDFITALQR